LLKIKEKNPKTNIPGKLVKEMKQAAELVNPREKGVKSANVWRKELKKQCSEISAKRPAKKPLLQSGNKQTETLATLAVKGSGGGGKKKEKRDTDPCER